MEPKRHNTRHAAARAAAAAFSSPSPSPPGSRSPQDPKSDMYESFQAWALKTYGDSAKTKTVTRRKYNRILKILKGEEQTSAENSKFRFWVKAKGFRIGPPHGHVTSSEQVLYIPCSKVPVVYCLCRKKQTSTKYACRILSTLVCYVVNLSATDISDLPSALAVQSLLSLKPDFQSSNKFRSQEKRSANFIFLFLAGT